MRLANLSVVKGIKGYPDLQNLWVLTCYLIAYFIRNSIYIATQKYNVHIFNHSSSVSVTVTSFHYQLTGQQSVICLDSLFICSLCSKTLAFLHKNIIVARYIPSYIRPIMRLDQPHLCATMLCVCHWHHFFHP